MPAGPVAAVPGRNCPLAAAVRSTVRNNATACYDVNTRQTETLVLSLDMVGFFFRAAMAIGYHEMP